MRWNITLAVYGVALFALIHYHDVWGQWLGPLCVPPADTVCMKCHDPAPKEQCE